MNTTSAVSRRLLGAAVALGLAVPLAPALAAGAEHFTATMSGDSEVPPTGSPGAGRVQATLDPATRVLHYTVTFHGLTGPATMAHFHGPAPAGANAGVEVPLGNAPTSPIHGEATLSADQVDALEQGKLYANVHTPKHPGGEIRGQLMKGA